MTHVTRRLTAKNRDQLRNPTLGNRVWATFTFFNLIHGSFAPRVHTRNSTFYLDRFRPISFFYCATPCWPDNNYDPVSVCLCTSVTSWSSIKTTERIELHGFRHGSFLPAILHCFMRKFGYLKNEGTFLWNFVPTLDLENFATHSDRILNMTRRRSSLSTTSRRDLAGRT